MSPRFRYYYLDLYISFGIRVALWVSFGLLALVLLAGCSSTGQNGRDELSFSGNFQGAKTRNYPPPTTGGDNEKSDSAPLKPNG